MNTQLTLGIFRKAHRPKSVDDEHAAKMFAEMRKITERAPEVPIIDPAPPRYQTGAPAHIAMYKAVATQSRD